MLKIWKSVPEFSTSLSNLPDVMIKINFRVPNTREDWNTRRMSEYMISEAGNTSEDTLWNYPSWNSLKIFITGERFWNKNVPGGNG